MNATIVEFENIGKELARIRKTARGMTSVEVATKAKICRPNYSQLENGKKINTEELGRIAAALNIKISFIISVDPEDLKRMICGK